MLRQFLNAALLGAMAFAFLLARVLLHGEPLNSRTQLLLTMVSLAAAVTGSGLTPLFEGRSDALSRWRAGAAFVWVFMGAMAFFYAIFYQYLSDQVDRPWNEGSILPLRSLLRSAGHFLAFAPNYLLPLPLPLLAAVAGLVLPGVRRRRG